MSNQITLNVPDISCGHCKTAIEGAVGELGVERVEVTIDAKTVDVAYGDDIDRDAIVAAIEEQGYVVA